MIRICGVTFYFTAGRSSEPPEAATTRNLEQVSLPPTTGRPATKKNSQPTKNIKRVCTLTNHSTGSGTISAGEISMWNSKKYSAIAVLGVGLAFAAASPASACGGCGGGYGYAPMYGAAYGGCGGGYGGGYGYYGYAPAYYGGYGGGGYGYGGGYGFGGCHSRHRVHGYGGYALASRNYRSGYAYAAYTP